MAEPAQKIATYTDLEALPPHLVGEILFGTLTTHPRPAPRHGSASISLADEIVGPFQKGRGGPGGWVFIDEPELHLGPHVVVPDIAGWRRERLQTLPETAWIETAPDWVCEVISPSTEKADKGPKRQIYAHYQVEHLWLVDPRLKCLEVFRRQERDWLLTHTFFENGTVSAPPFGQITFSLDVLWPFDPPANPAT